MHHTQIMKIYNLQIFDDFYHFIKFHQKQLEDIMNFAIERYDLMPCNSSDCHFAVRHHRLNEQIPEAQQTDYYLDIYIETMDSLHCYIFHSISTTLRRSDRKQEDEKSDTNDTRVFLRTVQEIKIHRNETIRCAELQNKYIISVGKPQHVNAVSDIIEVGNYIQIVLNFVPDPQIGTGHDTESADIDLEMMAPVADINACNLGLMMSKRNLSWNSIITSAADIFQQSKIDIKAFNIGINWIYDDHIYEDIWNKYGTSEYRVNPRCKEGHPLNMSQLFCIHIIHGL